MEVVLIIIIIMINYSVARIWNGMITESMLIFCCAYMEVVFIMIG